MSKKIVLFEALDTDFGGHFFEHSITHTKFLKENDYEPIFVMGGSKTKRLEFILDKLKVENYKLSVLVYKSRSKLPSILKVTLNFFLELIRYIKLIKIGQKENAKLISVLTFGIYEPLQLLLASFYTNNKIPITVIIHRVTTDVQIKTIKNFVSWFLSFFSFFFLRYMINKKMLKVIVHTRYAKDFFSRYVSKKVVRVPYPSPIDYEKFSYEKSYSRRILRLPQNSNLLLFFNPDAVGKSPDILFSSFPYVKNKFKVVLVGNLSDAFIKKINNFISKYNLKDKVILRNKFLYTEEKFHYYNAADIILQPYLFYNQRARGMSGILLDAILLRKPVIITNVVGEDMENVKRNKLGLVVKNTVEDWSNALNKSLSNINKLTALCQEKAEKLRQQHRIASNLDNIYK